MQMNVVGGMAVINHLFLERGNCMIVLQSIMELNYVIIL